ncbi:prestin-like isoform X3 [Lineus longissimus]|uniref:prestin-like isoform X3 n=1 Tax=Lineus longissimus TaxID=88925 RepID=UPI00315CDF3F
MRDEHFGVYWQRSVFVAVISAVAMRQDTTCLQSLQELLSSPQPMENPGLDIGEEHAANVVQLSNPSDRISRPTNLQYGEASEQNSITSSLAETPRHRGSRVPSILIVNRPVYSQQYFDQGFQPQRPQKKTIKERFKEKKENCTCSLQCIKTFLFRFLPFLDIMSKYEVREDAVSDLLSGLTVGIMQIPQSMAYAMLASLSPVYGIYTSFFPVIIYFFLGTSKHISVGTFAVISLMVGSALDRETANFQPDLNITLLNESEVDLDTQREDALMDEKVQIAIQLTVLVGIIQLAMGICQLGFFTMYLSQPLVSGFTTGAAFHVFTSQITHVFGLSIPKYYGPLKLIYIYRDLFSNIHHTNIASLVTSLICVAALVGVKEGINNKFKDKMKMPVPIELLVVIAATVISHFAKISEVYKVKVVGYIPTGIPPPQLPATNYMRGVFIDAVVIAIIAYAISVSMAKIFATKHNYEVESNQELIAHGGSNIISSFFLCYVSAASLSRSLVQESMGGKTQIAGLISSSLVLVVLLAVAPLFRSLPNCVLASIILVALKGMFLQFQQLKDLWKISKYDFSIWIVSWLATALLDVDLGLGIALAFTLFTVVWRTQGPYTCILGRMPHTDIYKDTTVYNDAEEVKGIKLFRFGGSLYYASAEYFLKKLYKKTGLNPRKLKAKREKYERKQVREEKKKIKEEKKDNRKNSKEVNLCMNISHRDSVEISTIKGDVFENETIEKKSDDNVVINVGSNSFVPSNMPSSLSSDPEWPMFDCHHLVIDCSIMGYMDCVGVNMLSQVIGEYKEADVKVFLTNCNFRIREMFRRMNFFDKNPKELLFLSVHDAVMAACEENNEDIVLQTLLIDTPMFPCYEVNDSRIPSASGSPTSFRKSPHHTPLPTPKISPKVFRRVINSQGRESGSPSIQRDLLEVPHSCCSTPDNGDTNISVIEEAEEHEEEGEQAEVIAEVEVEDVVNEVDNTTRF